MKDKKLKMTEEKKNKSLICNVIHTYYDGLVRAERYLIKHWIKSLITVVIFLLLAIFVSFTSAFFVSFFIAFLIMQLDSRVPIVFALVCLIVCPFLIIFNYQLLAEQFAIWVYDFLAISVVLQIVGYIYMPKTEESKNKELPIASHKKIHLASEGVILKPVVKKQETEEKSKSARRTVLATLLAFVSIIIFVGGGIFLYKDYNAPKKVGISSEMPVAKKDNSESPNSQIDKAAISITVLNGNGKTGSAAEMKKILEDQDFKVGIIGNAESSNYPETVIHYQPGSAEKADLVANSLQGKYVVKTEETTTSQETEILVIVGLK